MSGHDGERGPMGNVETAAGARAGRPPGAVALRVAAVALLAAAGVWAYRAHVTSGRPAMDMSVRASAAGAALPVDTVPVERGPIASRVTYTGSVAAFSEEDIYPRVTGRIVEMPVYPGDAVRPGQVVARLDDVELASRVREAAAGATAAEASLAQMEADVTATHHGSTQMERELVMATADLAAAREGGVQMERELTMAEAEAGYQEPLLAREERLYRSGAVAQQDVEGVRASAAAARARVEVARARIAQARAMIASAEAKVEAARARVDQARAMEAGARRKREAMAAMAVQSRAQLQTAQVVRDYVSIEAPSAGYVVKRLVAPGVLVQPGMAILKMAQIDRVRLQANVGERDLASIRVGSPVTVTTAGGGAGPAGARVTAVFPFVDPGGRTGVVEAVVPNPERRLLPGQYVQMAFVTGERPTTLIVPRTAVVRMGGKTTVWVVEGDRATPREVTTGLENPDRIEIATGLTGTEHVVARGHEALYAGARVADVGAGRPAPAPGGHAGHGGEAPAAPPPAHPPAAAGPAPGKEAPHGTGH